MWSFIDEYINYIKAICIGVVVCVVFYAGFHIGNGRYLEYKASVEATAKAQEAHIQAIQKEHELVNKGIQDEYESKLSLVRQYYANGVRNPSGSTVSGLSTTSKVIDANAAYNQLAEQCSETTIQLVELQKWINEQIGIK